MRRSIKPRAQQTKASWSWKLAGKTGPIAEAISRWKAPEARNSCWPLCGEQNVGRTFIFWSGDYETSCEGRIVFSSELEVWEYWHWWVLARQPRRPTWRDVFPFVVKWLVLFAVWSPNCRVIEEEGFFSAARPAFWRDYCSESHFRTDCCCSILLEDESRLAYDLVKRGRCRRFYSHGIVVVNPFREFFLAGPNLALALRASKAGTDNNKSPQK